MIKVDPVQIESFVDIAIPAVGEIHRKMLTSLANTAAEYGVSIGLRQAVGNNLAADMISVAEGHDVSITTAKQICF